MNILRSIKSLPYTSFQTETEAYNIAAMFYTQILKKNRIRISLTEQNHCYENAMTEHINGILKDEFYLDQTLMTWLTPKEQQKTQLIYTTK